MKFFATADLESMDALRQAYRRLVLEYHPDKHEEEEAQKWTEEFKNLQAEYDELLQNLTEGQYEQARTTYKKEKALQDMIDKVMKIPGVYVELCGCWLWVSGDTFKQKVYLKAAGFKWSNKKERWYWGLTLTTKKKKRARHKDMEEIYQTYGREVLGDSDAKEPLLIG